MCDMYSDDLYREDDCIVCLEHIGSQDYMDDYIKDDPETMVSAFCDVCDFEQVHVRCMTRFERDWFDYTADWRCPVCLEKKPRKCYGKTLCKKDDECPFCK